MAVWLPIAQIADNVRRGESKAIDLVEKSLNLIDEKQEYKAIIAKTADRARARAQEIDTKVANGEDPGKLAGVPFIAKDNFLVFGAETTAASNILRGFEAPYQATCIERLESEGAICVAKANLDAFAHGSSTENSDFMTTLNPYDKTRVPGGSSGGSAASVALEIAPFALGTDTGGSIRLPASFCGVVGYKPTYGLVSRSGVVAMASSTDVIGPLAKDVADTAAVLEVMSGRDELDGTTIERNPESYTELPSVNVKKLRIGVIKEYQSEGVDSGVKAQVENSINRLKELGATIEVVSLPSLPLALACYYVICPAEVSSNLSRYDGQRFGFTEKSATNLDDSYTKSRSSGFGDEAKRRIMIGTFVLSSGYYDAYYKKAQLVRTKLTNEFKKAFESYDILIGPTSPNTAFKIGENTDDPLAMYLVDIMTVGVNLVGVPAISIPAGMSNGLPVGVQLIADQHKDRDLLAVAKTLEENLV
jgi:aspartyl-tRNA(Asn)/glutamyl-tRNA(Gln) amidotransferase subunit A